MKHKLSPLEEIRTERDKLRAECSRLESNIGKNIYYVRHNFGSLLASTVFNSSRNAIYSFFGKTPSSSFVTENLGLPSLSAVWNIARPFVAGWVTKKIASYLFGK
jgi:predicted alpha/beta hydrolase